MPPCLTHGGAHASKQQQAVLQAAWINHEGFTILIYYSVTVDDEVTHPEANFSIGYFFVGRKFRGLGVGKAAVKKLLGLFSGCWQIFHTNQNAAASAFWKKVIPKATLNNFSVHSEFIDGYDCTLYKFRHE